MSIDIPEEVKTNYQSYFDDGYELGGARYKHLNNWTHLSIQLFEARKFLDLAKSIDNLSVKEQMDEILIQQSLFRSFTLS